jgi:hypothetical protein
MTRVFLALLSVTAIFASDTALDRLKRASEQAQVLNDDRDHKDADQRMAAVHSALLNWIESRLPHGETVTPGSLSILGDKLNEELEQAGLAAKEEPPDADPVAAMGWPGYGFPSVEFEWRPELPNSAIVTARISVPCGAEARVFVYDIRGPRWVRVLSDVPRNRFLGTAGVSELSAPDREGNRLLLIHYGTSQCASMWMGLSYSVYRINVDGDHSERLISDDSGYYAGNDRGPLFVVNPNEFVIEFDGFSVDLSILVRTHIRRYRFDAGVTRLDPVALQPQDFLDEWLTRPWREMQSRSQGDLKGWHDNLHSDHLHGDYLAVIPCASRPNRWLIDFELDRSDERHPDEKKEVFFVVRDSGGYNYTMESVSSDRPDGCPGEGIKSSVGSASDQNPWLSATELQNLR